MTEMVDTAINGRWTLKLPPHRAARPEWPWWEATRLAHMHHHLAGSGGTVFDIGAEEGDFPALWASWGNDVVLFEANARVWPNIKAIFDANDLAPLVTFPGFAADHDGDRDTEHLGGFDLGPLWPTSAHGPVIGDHGFCNLSERPDIPRLRIDKVAELVRPTAITIDVEGAELSVLRGAERTLAEDRPLVWVSVHEQFMADMYGHTPAELDAYMRGLDYEPRWLCTDHEAHWSWTPVELGLGPR